MDKKLPRVHFVGIGGSGISGCAVLARYLGYEVTGCDNEASTAYSQDISVGHSPEHLKNVDLVVTTPAMFFGEENPEITQAKDQSKLVTWQQFLGERLTKGKKIICIAGTHGKSTTTAMAGQLLENADLDPTVLVGAKVEKWGGNCRTGSGEWTVIEADEFYDNFLYYKPEIVVLNNIEFDHPDYFKDETVLFESFKKFIDNLTGEKILICNSDSEGVQKLLENLGQNGIQVIKYGFKGSEINFELGVKGKHNFTNALGVLELAKVLGIPDKIVKTTLKNFEGIGRRMELIKSTGGVEIYDDYAHHPTAIKATLEALREVHPNARIWAIVEPHGFSRTKAMLNIYEGVFETADKVLIGPIFKSRDTETFGMNPGLVAQHSAHKDVKGVETFDEIKNIISSDARAGDVILIMGAGKSYRWAREISTVFN